ncbi:ABC transporter substrate-binding protein [Acuticoccus sp. M5D2P5]|uniref:ABC transporter substrate-binding protein n=1 Tax=Acuticoccus kalidii TaxID=2910977 RepID=UPI001F449894|nr:ABC transporter substrate-binding protein [Acuticoccus kalidii]MCF3936515.1 ABC transporter substrate-binding protein [Acuticoccus kalidii]
MNCARTVLAALVATTALAGPTALPALAADAPVIALSNSFYGNDWRRQMVDSFTAAAEQAKSEGLISNFVVLNGDGSVPQQQSQIADLILRGVDAIAINAASETALNDIISKACSAGIAVIAFDSLLTADCAHTLGFDFTAYKTEQAEATLKLIGDKGNVIVVRGVKGSGPDEQMNAAQMAVLKQHPDVNIAATVYGQATAPVAQAAIANVLPSLPKIDAVLGQGGSDDYGIAQAFEQYGGEYEGHMPVIEGGGSADFIRWWAAQHKAHGYTTTSMNTTPGIGGAAFWVALALADGKEVPKEMTMPVAVVEEANLDEYADMPQGRIVSPTYTQEWVNEKLLDAPAD